MKRLLVSVTTLLLSCAALSAVLECPSSIAVKESLDPAIDGWVAGSNRIPHDLAGVTFFDGDPKNRASLVPDRDFKSGNEQVAVWKFAMGKAPIWLSCDYLGTSITVGRSLPAFEECRVTSAAGSVVKRIECK
jgi:hypothetical protein